MASSFSFEYRDHRFSFRVIDDALELSLDGLPRKRRARSAHSGKAEDECLYVWTNVELHWEEHHYIEGRWWPNTGRLLVTANRQTIHDVQLGKL